MRKFFLKAVAVASLFGVLQGASILGATGITNGGHNEPPVGVAIAVG